VAVLDAQGDAAGGATGDEPGDGAAEVAQGDGALGVVPFNASLKIWPSNSFWVYDEHLVIVEDWHAELRIDDADSVAHLPARLGDLQSAVHGNDAHNVINAAQRAINSRGTARETRKRFSPLSNALIG